MALVDVHAMLTSGEGWKLHLARGPLAENFFGQKELDGILNESERKAAGARRAGSAVEAIKLLVRQGL